MLSFAEQYDRIKRHDFLRYHVLIGEVNVYCGTSRQGYYGLFDDEIKWDFFHGFATELEANVAAKQINDAQRNVEPLAEVRAVVIDKGSKDA